MEEKNIINYIDILDRWLKNHSNKKHIHIGLDKKIPVPLEYFVYWLVTHAPTIIIIEVEISKEYTLSFICRVENTLVLALRSSFHKSYIRPISPNEIIFYESNVFRSIDKKMNNLSIYYTGDYEPRLLIEHDEIVARFESPQVIFNTLNKDDILNQISTIYNLPVTKSDFEKLEYIINTKDETEAQIVIHLQSDVKVYNKMAARMVSHQRKYHTEIMHKLSKYLKLKTKSGRISNVKSEYMFTYDGELKISLKISVKMYENEEYYSSYGFYETAIDNICRKSLGSTQEEIEKIADQLSVNIEELTDQQICEKLWTRFYTLKDKDFD